MTPSSTPQFTVGVEEEFHVVDPGTRRLSPRAAGILERLDTSGRRSPFSGEVQASMAETRAGPSQTLGELRVDLVRRRRALADAAREAGVAVAAAGTLPLFDRRELRLSDEPQYARIAERHQEVVRGQFVCGCHVHVGVGDRTNAVRLLAHLAPWTHVLLALSASSPFYDGRDTGYASYRTISWSRWPTSGPAPRLASLDDYERLVDDLIASGTITDGGQIYWYVRPSRRFATLEFRVADAATTLDEALLQAGLARALVTTAWRENVRGVEPPEVRRDLLHAAAWHAARYGIEERLLDPVRARRLDARQAVDHLLDHVGDALEHHGDGAEVRRLADRAFTRGSSASRQRGVVAREGSLAAVVDAVVEETVTQGSQRSGAGSDGA